MQPADMGAEDIIKNGSGPGGLSQKNLSISAISQIGGQDPVAYLKNFTTFNMPNTCTYNRAGTHLLQTR